MFASVVLGALLAASSPAPAPTPSPTPHPYSLDGAFTWYSSRSNPVNATGALDEANGKDLAARSDVSNALFTLTKNGGVLRGSATVGAYALPVVGLALNPTTQQGANAWLYGFVPLAYVAYVPNGHMTLSAGKLPSLFGQENAFTTQNINIERGLMWEAETTVGRGVRLAYTNARWNATFGYDDGFYAGNSGRAIEGLVGFNPDAATSIQVAAIVPGANTPPNATASVANKREFDLMVTRQIGRWTLSPYVLAVESPASSALGYTSAESALGAAFLAQYAWSPMYSIGARFETFANHSAENDASLNADLVGYGPGTRATTFTLTPAYRSGLFLARAEVARVNVAGAVRGLAFGEAGTGAAQTRVLFEMGVQF